MEELVENTQNVTVVESDSKPEKKRKGLKPEKKPRATTSKGHFLKNADLLAEVRKSKAQGEITAELAKMFIILATNYARHPWYCRYPDYIKEEMISASIENLVNKWHLFDLERSKYPNPFSYYTEACHRIFDGIKKRYKHEQQQHDKMLNEANLNPSWNEYDDEEL